MLYKSTRNDEIRVEASQAIIKGLSDDGGLFIPESIPSVSLDEIKNLLGRTYNERAESILSKFLTDFSPEQINHCVSGAYTSEKFGSKNISELHKLNDSVSFLELWHGPTCAFKDMALQILPYLLTTSVKINKLDKTVVILVATSGDTGKAALEGFADVPGTKIIVFFPDGGVSNIQRLQMITQSGGNVYSCAVKGNFDDVQTFVKQIFTDSEYKKKLNAANHDFSSANSINWGRLVPQVVYYIDAYCKMIDNGEIKLGDEINVVVPTGNFGNILAAYYAKRAGVPIKKLVCASNSNNVLTDFIRTGVYNKNRKFNLTVSPSMDILISSNLERLLYDLSDCYTVKKLMQDLKNDGKYEITAQMKAAIGELLWADFCDDNETLKTINDAFTEYGYLMDTHTAVGYAVYKKYIAETGDNTKTIIASTASPFKFNNSVYKAIKGEAPDNKSEFELLSEVAEASGLSVPKSLAELETKKPRFEQVVTKDGMRDVVTEFLGL